MSAVTIPLGDKYRQILEQLSARAGMSMEDFLQQRVEHLLDDQVNTFQEASNYVLNKNAELYRRLAQ